METNLGQKFLYVDLRDFFSDIGSGGDENKALKMTSRLVIFRAFFKYPKNKQ